jgi:hypothetical protein
MTLPSGTAVTSTYDAMGRPSGVSAQAASLAPVYGDNASYAPAGALQQLSLGNGLTERVVPHFLLTTPAQPLFGP